MLDLVTRSKIQIFRVLLFSGLTVTVPQQHMRENVLTRTTPPDYASLLLLVAPRTRFSGISWDGIVAFTSSHFRSVITCCAASAPWWPAAPVAIHGCCGIHYHALIHINCSIKLSWCFTAVWSGLSCFPHSASLVGLIARLSGNGGIVEESYYKNRFRKDFRVWNRLELQLNPDFANLQGKRKLPWKIR